VCQLVLLKKLDNDDNDDDDRHYHCWSVAFDNALQINRSIVCVAEACGHRVQLLFKCFLTVNIILNNADHA